MRRETLTYEEKYLLNLLRQALSGEDGTAAHENGDCAAKQDHPEKGNDGSHRVGGDFVRSPDWNRLFLLAERHSVLSLLYDVLTSGGNLPGEFQTRLEKTSRQIVLQNYHLLFLTGAVIQLLKENGIQSVCLKGAAVCGCYPVPELRKSGDVDLLLVNPEEIERAVSVLEKAGLVVSADQHSVHHVAMETRDQIEVEIHTMMAGPFDHKGFDRYLYPFTNPGGGQYEEKDVMGVTLPVLCGPVFAFQLLLHMLQHFLRSGFGIKLLCDWAVFWNGTDNEQTLNAYLKMARGSGLKRFSDYITAVCVQYLGLKREKAALLIEGGGEPDTWPNEESVEAFLWEILEAEEFGKSSGDRMVMVRGSGILAYLREFHHQMRLNHPKASRAVILWPGLWAVTLFCFLYNNKKIRGISTLKILKNAGKRGQMAEKLGLFRE
ncbi:MAG: nucleotidyltransferase family protein [Lachnospiraceae bacterium]|nr:nucleotidyltransferase family protein [Lachnospiraceae bacterium]